MTPTHLALIVSLGIFSLVSVAVGLIIRYTKENRER